jgi:hypothetical protein
VLGITAYCLPRALAVSGFYRAGSCNLIRVTVLLMKGAIFDQLDCTCATNTYVFWDVMPVKLKIRTW